MDSLKPAQDLAPATALGLTQIESAVWEEKGDAKPKDGADAKKDEKKEPAKKEEPKKADAKKDDAKKDDAKKADAKKEDAKAKTDAPKSAE